MPPLPSIINPPVGAAVVSYPLPKLPPPDTLNIDPGAVSPMPTLPVPPLVCRRRNPVAVAAGLADAVVIDSDSLGKIVCKYIEDIVGGVVSIHHAKLCIRTRRPNADVASSCDRHLLGRTPGEEAELFAVARITVIHVADVCTNDCRRAVVAEPSSETRVGVSDTHRIIRRRAELGGTCYVQLNRRTRRPNADVAGGRRKHNIVEAGLTTLNRERSRHRAAGEVEVYTGAAHAVGKAQYCSAVV